MKAIDLFAGIGGYALGMEASGIEVVGHCEIDEGCQDLLSRRWEGHRLHADVRTLTKDSLSGVDVIAGGFSCQDVSIAGKQIGLSGERSGLWSECIRLAREIDPRLLLVENVSALRWNGLGTVLSDLAKIGYDAEWHCYTAHFVGGRHLRDRIFLAAKPRGEGGYGGLRASLLEAADVERGNWAPEPQGVPRAVAQKPGKPGMARLKALGNAIVPSAARAFSGAAVSWVSGNCFDDQGREFLAEWKADEGWKNAKGVEPKWPRSGVLADGVAYSLPDLCKADPHLKSGLWPTPTASVAQSGERAGTWLARRERLKVSAKNGNGAGMPLTIAVQLFPEGEPIHASLVKPNAPFEFGYLNPDWVEWLMGFPAGWTR